MHARGVQERSPPDCLPPGFGPGPDAPEGEEAIREWCACDAVLAASVTVSRCHILAGSVSPVLVPCHAVLSRGLVMCALLPGIPIGEDVAQGELHGRPQRPRAGGLGVRRVPESRTGGERLAGLRILKANIRMHPYSSLTSLLNE